MAICPTCEDRELAAPSELACGVCTICAKLTGVHPLPPRRRPAAPCQRCNKTSFVRAVPRVSAEVGYEPIRVTREGLSVSKGWLTDPAVAAGAARGELELYICRGCGFVEWYCQEPSELPIGPQFMTEVVDYESETPYR